jgi:MFS family permease
LRGISAAQWKSGLAAWLGWFFDGLELHLYTLVAAPIVAHLIHVADSSDPHVKQYSSWIQAAFLVGWALGGAIFGRLGDKLGRSRALCLTILTYAAFTGLSYFAQTWWQLMLFRFVAALGIGGEWAVGACLLAETWPRRWGPWIAAVLQSGVNIGILCAVWIVDHLSGYPEKCVFLVGIAPALIVFWIRRQVPETEAWHEARATAAAPPGLGDLFRGPLARTTWLTMIVCSLSLTGWWGFLFWHPQHLRTLPEMAGWTAAEKQHVVNQVFFRVIFVSLAGNYFIGWLAKLFGYRRVIVWSALAFVVALFEAYHVPRTHEALLIWLPIVGFCSGVFGLYTMYLPALFPTLLRTSGAGFCFNVGRVAAAVGTVVFGLFVPVGNFRPALMAMGALFLLAAIVAAFLPDVAQD